jgi:hypothetical protein
LAEQKWETGKVLSESLPNNNVVCTALKQKSSEKRMLKTRRRPTMEQQKEQGERHTHVFVIAKISRARRGWGHVGNST